MISISITMKEVGIARCTIASASHFISLVERLNTEQIKRYILYFTWEKVFFGGT
jgi:hypothetical protein